MTQTHALNGPAWIVVPADQPEQFAEAAQAADVVVLDLHNGVLPRDKEFARQCILECPLDPARTVIRVNPVGTDEHTADLQALETTTYRRVVVPQVEATAETALERDDGAMRTLICIGYVVGTFFQVAGLVWAYVKLRRTLSRHQERDDAMRKAGRDYEAQLKQAEATYKETYRNTPLMHEWWRSEERAAVESTYHRELKRIDALTTWDDMSPTAGDLRLTTAQLDGYWEQGALLLAGILLSGAASVASLYLPGD